MADTFVMNEVCFFGPFDDVGWTVDVKSRGTRYRPKASDRSLFFFPSDKNVC